MKQLAILSIGLCVLAVGTLVTEPTSATQWECGERSNLPAVGKNYCAGGDFRQSEFLLEKAFNALFKKHKAAGSDTSVLISAQSDFRSYRDNQCATENKHTEDKPFHSMMVAQCKTRLTKLRIDELKHMQQQDQ